LENGLPATSDVRRKTFYRKPLTMDNRRLELECLKHSRFRTQLALFCFVCAYVLNLEATFAAPDFYARPREEIFELETQLKTARDKVAHLYARWHELELLQSVPSP
jgi:hypothetical protein